MSYEGILNIDKPTGMTSHDVVARVRRTAGLRRVGHTGTLDPLATGVLVVCLGRATRLVEYVVGRPKTYEAQVKLGQSTNTYDSDGEITVERPLPDGLTQNDIVQSSPSTTVSSVVYILPDTDIVPSLFKLLYEAVSPSPSFLNIPNDGGS